jgi:dihydroxyacetone kinase
VTRLVNQPDGFAAEALEGFAQAHAEHVVAVPGGVVRATDAPRGQVAVVLGGGSGHYPAFAGWVGQGFAHGAACGNTFASPSAGQICSVARAADAGAGVLLAFGNYAGDVMQFGLAAARLRAEGIDARTLAVTDDVASAPLTERHHRRGVAGDLLVFKVTAAAAEAGMSLDEVEAVAQRANAATGSFGVAFSGCTLPGSDSPLFSVQPGQMGLGLGIHGEPGLGEKGLQSADAVAGLLLAEVLGDLAGQADAGASLAGRRVAVLVNGLGGTKYEELFVVYRSLAKQLREAGMTVVRPEVGEHVTSLDMAGLSLSLMFLDDELETLWSAPADAPAYRRGPVRPPAERRVALAATEVALPPATPGSRAAGACAARMFEAAERVVAEHAHHLGAIDAVAGDGDHGLGMQRGSAAAARAARTATDRGAGLRSVVLWAAEAWAEAAGGSSGALWGAALTAVASRLTDDTSPGAADTADAAQAALDAVVTLGGAAPGDKTMVDAAAPFVAALRTGATASGTLAEVWKRAAAVAIRAAEDTAHIPARLGRARTHGEASLGTPDAGAVSFALIVTAVGAVLARTPEESS